MVSDERLRPDLGGRSEARDGESCCGGGTGTGDSSVLVVVLSEGCASS
jgi:hypothetical protein